MSGEFHLNASQAKIWDALNDPEILRRCIGGCESLEKISDTELKAVMKTKVGPVAATFKADMHLCDLDPPNSYRIRGEGSGGAAGFAKGSIGVKLIPDGTGTKLLYDVDANVGGKLAQVGQRLIDGVAKKLADEFFENFAKGVGEPQTVEPAAAVPIAPAAPEQSRSVHRTIWLAVIAVVLVIVVGLFIYFLRR